MQEIQIPEKNIQRKTFKEKLIIASNSKYGTATLYFISFIESAFFPIPPDFLMIPMIVAKPSSWKKLAFWVTFYSVLGAFLGYFIGAILFDTVGVWIVDTYSLHNEMEKVRIFYQNNAFWSIVVAGFTPIPYKLFTVAGGVFHINLLVLLTASIIGRGARFFLVGYISHIGGNKAFWTYLKKLNRSTIFALSFLVVFMLYWFLVR